jgi:hypothetical protein
MPTSNSVVNLGLPKQVALDPKPKVIQPPHGTASATFRAVVNAAYELYITGTDITVENLVKTSGRQPRTVGAIIGSFEFKEACELRGIQIRNNPRTELNPEQIYFLSILTDPTDKRTLQGKLKAAGVPYARYRAWLKQPKFAARLNGLAEGLLIDHTGDVLTQLTAKATQGDLKAIQYYLEINGRHDPKRQVQVDLQATMLRVIEIITKHVTDPTTLTAIANEMAMLGSVSGGLTINGSSQPFELEGP